MEETIKASGESQEVVSDNPEIKEEAKSEEDKVAYASYQKVLSDAKKWKTRARENEERLAKLEAANREFHESKLKEEGKSDELILRLKEELNSTRKEVEETRAKFGTEQLKYTIREEAAKKGCVNTEVLMRLIDKDDLRMIEIDEGYQPRREDVSALVDKIKKDHAEINLFRKEPINIHDDKVKGIVSEVKNPNDMSIEELEAELAKLNGN